MKFVALAPLQSHDKDFRYLLPMLDRGKYKNPFIPKQLWEKMGSKFNCAMWDRLLRKHRMRVILEEREDPSVSAEYFDDTERIHILVSQPDLWDIDDLKYEIIQTAMHELIHANQHCAHDGQYEKPLGNTEPPDEYNEYLSTFGEVQAYAHCCALDWIHGKENTIFRYNECSYKIKRELYKHTYRWLMRYEEIYSH